MPLSSPLLGLETACSDKRLPISACALLFEDEVLVGTAVDDDDDGGRDWMAVVDDDGDGRVLTAEG